MITVAPNNTHISDVTLEGVPAGATVVSVSASTNGQVLATAELISQSAVRLTVLSPDSLCRDVIRLTGVLNTGEKATRSVGVTVTHKALT